MKHLATVLTRIEDIITKLLLASIVILVFYSAMVRWLGVPVAWSVEMGQLLFIWLIFLGANQAMRKNRHIGVDVFTNRLPDKLKTPVNVFTDSLIACFLIVIIFYGTQHAADHALRSVQNLPLSYSYITASVPAGCTLMLVTLLMKWISFWFNRNKNPSITDEEDGNSRGMLS
ncbi:TRAP transporter small permease [Salibacterium aidingense]|uniref:TRAP transporter small permease n=1 Tax=Salibacterium aidingense TaxID=384933 RepID=UPI003BC0BD2B